MCSRATLNNAHKDVCVSHISLAAAYASIILHKNTFDSQQWKWNTNHRVLRLPQSERAVVGVGGDEILMRMMTQSDDLFVVHLHGCLKFAGQSRETVKHRIFADTVDPVTCKHNCLSTLGSSSTPLGDTMHDRKSPPSARLPLVSERTT
jgi:hypothetical protein